MGLLARESEYPRWARVWGNAHATVVYLLVVVISIVLLVDGTTTARIIGAVLLAISFLIAGHLVQRHLTSASE